MELVIGHNLDWVQDLTAMRGFRLFIGSVMLAYGIRGAVSLQSGFLTTNKFYYAGSWLSSLGLSLIGLAITCEISGLLTPSWMYLLGNMGMLIGWVLLIETYRKTENPKS